MNDAAIKFRPVATSAMERFNTPTTCECCGREDLKTTVKVATIGGAPMWMGTGCAAKACGVGIKEFRRALKAEQDAHDAAEAAAKEAAHRAADDKWQAFLNTRAGMIVDWSGKPDRFRQIEAIGGFAAARAAYREAV